LVSNGKTQACNFEKIHPRLNSQEWILQRQCY
jgi:hypothetical protein